MYLGGYAEIRALAIHPNYKSRVGKQARGIMKEEPKAGIKLGHFHIN
jgi:hypothetical protein